MPKEKKRKEKKKARKKKRKKTHTISFALVKGSCPLVIYNHMDKQSKKCSRLIYPFNKQEMRQIKFPRWPDVTDLV